MTERATPPAAPRSQAWIEILRLGNVFTAASNAIAGFLIVAGSWRPLGLLALLTIAAMLLYLAGMVLNDAYDAELDARERPERPIPSGRIRRRSAWIAGWTLLAGGVGASAAASYCSLNPVLIGVCLALAIIMYNGGLKSTPAGPWLMGWCRMLCVLLGSSAAVDLSSRWQPWAYAAVVGAYTVALTRLARKEAEGSAAENAAVRERVSRRIRGFIGLDAAAATLAAGWQAGLAVLVLLVPTRLLARRAAMT
jgi:4-hydroxybenzoate polyprenyltransferase